MPLKGNSPQLQPDGSAACLTLVPYSSEPVWAAQQADLPDEYNRDVPMVDLDRDWKKLEPQLSNSNARVMDRMFIQGVKVIFVDITVM